MPARAAADDAGYRPRAGKKLIEECDRITSFVSVHAENDDVLRVEAGIDVRHAPEASNEQSRAHRHHHRERHLDNHERIAPARDAATPGSAAGSILECFGRITMTGPERRCDSKDQSRADRYRRDEDGDGRIDAELAHRQKLRRLQRDERARSDPSEREPDAPADRREHETFGDGVSYQSRMAGTQGEAKSGLSLSSRGADEEEVADVRARDEQQHADGRQQNRQSAPRVTNEKIVQWDDPCSHFRIRRGMISPKPCNDGLKLGIRVRDRRVRSEARDRVQPVRSPP